MTDKGNTYKAWVKGVFPAAYVEKLGSMYCICKFTFMQDSPLDNYDICDVSANMVWKRAWALIDDLPPQTEQPEELAELRKYNTKLLDENIWYRNANAEIRRNFQRLLNAVNKVTAAHRHGNPVTIRALDNLSNRQLEIEQAKDGG